jgi:Bacterial SH3 domain
MKACILKTTIAALLTGLCSAAFACDGAPICVVKDPTGTPLNIRSAANGTIIGTAKNGTELEFIDHVEHEGKAWARVAKFDDDAQAMSVRDIWVFADYLKCEDEIPAGEERLIEVTCKVADPTGTPLNVREEPKGAIFASVRNGETLRINGSRSVGGKLWAVGYRDSADNPVGWVFDDFLNCE